MQGLFYALQGRLHAALSRAAREARGQGTVEYVGLILLLAGVLATVVMVGKEMETDIGKTIVDKLQSAINSVGNKK